MGSLIKIMLALLAVLVSVANAQDTSEAAQAKKYQECLASVAQDSKNALNEARKWYIEGGGVAAQHCEGMALFEQERFSEAAQLFETIVGKLQRNESVNDFASNNKKNLTIQLNYLAGLAWHSAKEYDKAYNDLTASINGLEENSPLSYEILIERGLVLASSENYKGAIEDYQRALDINSEKVDAFLLRAEAFRKLNEHPKARLDLNMALSIEPNNPDVLFESGVNYRMQHHDEKALVEWKKLIAKYPDSYWQKLAEDNIRLIGK
ncbi:MAG: tetratricopeptide repeat protein [Alphaproteobacteria bacterium]|nr:tetratricopeptide repeat protein [Alphaproteobacteria bacterium]HPF46033.1 tetratricopeptide repeat protein [Emcibacteraceae bacterium]HRW28799.1 tetratricopeptide repeat protein [Emcibacteraceae bacterium]